VEISPDELNRLESDDMKEQIKSGLSELGFKEVEISRKGYYTGAMDNEKNEAMGVNTTPNKQSETFTEKNGLALLALLFIVRGWAAVGLSFLVKGMQGKTWEILQVAPAFIVVILFLGAFLMAGRLLFIKGSSKAFSSLVALLAAGCLVLAMLWA